MAKSQRNRKRIRQEGNEQALEIDYILYLFSFLLLHFVVFSEKSGGKKITSKDKSESGKYQKRDTKNRDLLLEIG